MGDYRLNIPEMINKKDAAIADYLKGWSGCTKKFVEENNVPREWLEEIEPEEPKVLSAEEWLKSNWRNRMSSGEEIFNAGHQNGRLERDLELRGLVEAAKEFIVNIRKYRPVSPDISWSEREKIIQASIDKLHEAVLENLKPL